MYIYMYIYIYVLQEVISPQREFVHMHRLRIQAFVLPLGAIEWLK